MKMPRALIPMEPFAFLVAGLFWVVFGLSASVGAEQVVVYTSVDEILSSEVFQKIERSTGLDILPVYDTEATKTTGLYLRLLQEHPNTRADVFWNSEFSRTLLLKEEGLLQSYTSDIVESIPKHFRDAEACWTGFSVRARVLAYNTEILKAREVPRKAEDLLAPQWKGRIAWANPLFGTTATHCGSLLATLGKDQFRSQMKAWNDQFQRVAGNGQAAELVARGTLPLALTDTDDVFRLVLIGRPIDAIPFDADGTGTLLIPNTVGILKNCPHLSAAQKFVDALLNPEIEEFLAESTSRQIPVRDDVPVPPDMETWKNCNAVKISYEEVASHVDPAMRITRELMTD